MKYSTVKTTFFLSFILSFLFHVSPLSAASYTSALFPWRDHNFQGLSFLISGTDSPDPLTLEYQTKAAPDSPDSWQTITDHTCTQQGDLIHCQVNLSANLETYLQFRLTYPAQITLHSFNYRLTKTLENADDPLPENDAIFYSNFKTLDPALVARKLSWKQAALTDFATDQIIVQTRATFDNQTWTAWQGNFALATPSGQINHESSQSAVFEASGGSILLKKTPSDNFSQIMISHLDQASPLTLTTPAALGDDEAAAFTNLSFHLSSLQNLRLGQQLRFTETIGDTTYQATGLISDLKPSENLVSVYAWQGSIPYQLTSNCDGHNFCFSPAAQLFPVQDTFIHLPPDVTATSSVTLANVQNPQVLDLQFIQPLTATCQELDESDLENPQCLTYALDLSSYYQNQSKPLALQYRLIYGPNRDQLITDVFLHQEQPQASPSGTTLNRLRGGKIFDPSKNSRPFYWN